MPAILWRGQTSLTPGKEKWSVTTSNVKVTVSFSGKYTDVLGNRDALGTALSGYTGMYCTQADIEELDGGSGRIELTLEGVLDPSSYTVEPLGTPIFELEFGELNRPLEQHSLCGVLNPDRPTNPTTQKKITWEDWALLDPDEDTGVDYDSTGSGSGIWASAAKWDIATYLQRKNKGEDSFILFTPTVRRTTVHLYPPGDVGSMSGRIQFPPSSAFDLSSFIWLAGPDRCTHNSRTFTRITEWIGADYWDTEVYSS
jgi:hypothetical protein